MKTRSIIVVLFALAAAVSGTAYAANDNSGAAKPDANAGVQAAATPAVAEPSAPATKPHSHSLEKVGAIPATSAAPRTKSTKDVHQHWRDSK